MKTPYEYLPEHWIDWLKKFALENGGKRYPYVSLGDFRDSVRVTFEDGTFLHFQYAFYAIDEDRKEIAVFTEHLGYHVFPLHDGMTYTCQSWVESPGNPKPIDDEEEYIRPTS